MKLLKELQTSRRTYKNVITFDNAQEAESAGYHILYHDELTGGDIYGKPLDENYPKVCAVAVVLGGVKENNR